MRNSDSISARLIFTCECWKCDVLGRYRRSGDHSQQHRRLLRAPRRQNESTRLLFSVARAHATWSRNHFYTASVLIHIGIVYHRLGQNDKALDYFNETLKIRQIYQRSKRHRDRALFNIALAERDRGNLSEARKRIEEALDMVEALRTKVGSQQLRASLLRFRATVSRVLYRLVDAFA